MDTATYFDRLVTSAERVARHAWHPGKDEAVDRCVGDVEDLAVAGRITAEQRERLREILLGACSTAA